MIITINIRLTNVKQIILKCTHDYYILPKIKYNIDNYITLHIDENINKYNIKCIEIYKKDKKFEILLPCNENIIFDYENKDIVVKMPNNDKVHINNIFLHIINYHKNCINYNNIYLNLSNNNYFEKIINDLYLCYTRYDDKYINMLKFYCSKIIEIDASHTSITNDEKILFFTKECSCEKLKKISLKNKIIIV